MERKINIAIDGFSSCGKSTLAKSLAKTLKYRYIDTGAMYRAIGLYALENKLINHKSQVLNEALIEQLHHVQVEFRVDPISHKSKVFLNGRSIGDQIRTIQIADLASQVSKLRQVRDKLQALQRVFVEEKGVIMDGRDIGTVVMPQAELKIFMTADHEVRALRRFKELEERGKPISLEEVKQRQRKRDQDDVQRAEDPLIQAEDAIVLDNSFMSPEEQLNFVLDKVHALINQ